MFVFIFRENNDSLVFKSSYSLSPAFVPGLWEEVMLEKICLATAITFSLYLLVHVPGPTGPELMGSSQAETVLALQVKQ
jgi:hypothetical protein